MEKPRKNKMLQIFGGSIAATIIAILAFAMTYGSMGEKLQVNSRQIEKNEIRFHNEINCLKIDMKSDLHSLEEKIDDLTAYLMKNNNRGNRKR